MAATGDARELGRDAPDSFWARRLRAVRVIGPVAGLVVAPLVFWIVLLAAAVADGDLAVDFRAYVVDAELILDGRLPVSPYPPIVAVLAIPFTVLPGTAQEVLATALMIACASATLHVLGIRDWRVYGAAAASAPVYSAVQTANVTLPFALGLALLWVWRDRPVRAGVVAALLIATKLFLWPVAIWLLATRRFRAVGVVALAGVPASVLAFATVGSFERFADTLAGGVDAFEERAYTFTALLQDLGSPAAIADATTYAAGAALLAAVLARGLRRDDERGALALAIGASLVLSPIVWLHYLALLLVPLALARPRLHPAWLLGALLWSCPPTTGSPAEKALVLAVGAAMLALALRSRESPARQDAPSS